MPVMASMYMLTANSEILFMLRLARRCPGRPDSMDYIRK